MEEIPLDGPETGYVEEPTSNSLPNLIDEAQRELTKIKQKLYGEVPILANEPKWHLGLSSGSTMLNLACTGRVDIGYIPDYYYVWCGRTGSGKTYINLASLAEASINPAFKDHDLYYDAPESGAQMSIEQHYGSELARRIKPPSGTRQEPKHSKTLEGFYNNVFNALETGPFVYVLDSMDALPTDDEWRDFQKKNKDRNKNDGEVPKNESGSYHTERARTNSHYLRLLFNQLQGSNSILIVIFQSREAIGFGSQFNPDTRGGGNAPTFFAGLELWSKVESHIHTSYKSNKIEQGVICEVKVKKGRITGKNRSVSIPIYNSFGIDDVGGMIDFLCEWKRWKRDSKSRDINEGSIKAAEFSDVPLSREDLVQLIIQKNYENELKEIVQETWDEIENAASVVRKSRYHQSE